MTIITHIYVVIMAMIGLVVAVNLANVLYGLYIKLKTETESNRSNQFDTINDFLDVLDRQIAFEVAYTLRRELTLGKNYNPINIDKDCNEISERVYSFINPDFLMEISKKNGKNVYTSEYWMNYIVRRTTVMMLDGYTKTFPNEVVE